MMHRLMPELNIIGQKGHMDRREGKYADAGSACYVQPNLNRSFEKN